MPKHYYDSLGFAGSLGRVVVSGAVGDPLVMVSVTDHLTGVASVAYLPANMVGGLVVSCETWLGDVAGVRKA